ncbi:DUF309 domain-containing protein [Thermostichus vulcanus]|uniref:DUF309 domain-containing protein n=1 Tax=Thermostichus vulcanus str. 'Rupite' TaxID=2813851 RepID=A0ABT0C9X9_THEVL|nr:DUF309 domain-containing protein [Thermostichus vulcanus]MCJ2542581.1 DUF309 domain-containing protein [Thermostichus vulcanus str. 'Rupite']
MTDPRPDQEDVTLQLAVQQFNRGEFYACHDSLEALWMEAVEPERRFYQGLLQTAVAYYHLTNQNRRGCMILLGEANGKLADYLPTYAGWDVLSLWRANQTNLRQLSQLPEGDPLPGLTIPTLESVENKTEEP